MVELGVAPRDAQRLEAHFRARPAWGGDLQVPRFARHDQHVADVMAQGGFCAFSERRIGKGGVAVCLPLTWPE